MYRHLNQNTPGVRVLLLPAHQISPGEIRLQGRSGLRQISQINDIDFGEWFEGPWINHQEPNPRAIHAQLFVEYYPFESRRNLRDKRFTILCGGDNALNKSIQHLSDQDIWAECGNIIVVKQNDFNNPIDVVPADHELIFNMVMHAFEVGKLPSLPTGSDIYDLEDNEEEDVDLITDGISSMAYD